MKKQPHILVVEDEESLLKLESILFSSRGYHVTGVADGKSALKMISGSRPDLVVLDVMLPEMDGVEVCRCIRGNADTKNLPVLMLTARKSSKDVNAGLSAGADAYITKPFKTAEVMETIEKLLNRQG